MGALFSLSHDYSKWAFGLNSNWAGLPMWPWVNRKDLTTLECFNYFIIMVIIVIINWKRLTDLVKIRFPVVLPIIIIIDMTIVIIIVMRFLVDRNHKLASFSHPTLHWTAVKRDLSKLQFVIWNLKIRNLLNWISFRKVLTVYNRPPIAFLVTRERLWWLSWEEDFWFLMIVN